jgi:hypothetical protein
MLVKRTYKELEQVSQADGTGPTMVTRKQKRGSGFKYSTKKALERSKFLKEKTKGRVLALRSVRKALTYPSELMSDIGIVDLAECLHHLCLHHLCLHHFTQLMKIKRRGLM